MKRSESITNIAKALAAFQGEVQNPKNTARNPHYGNKYAPLEEIINAAKPVLARHGLSYIQSPSAEGDKITIITTIFHSSGEWIEGEPLTLKADKTTAQGAGSAITYARRYSLCAMLGISGEDDDDGGAAEMPKSDNRGGNKQNDPKEYISKEQQKNLFAIAGKDNVNLVKEILEKHNYSKTDQVKKADYDAICKEIQSAMKASPGGEAQQ